MSAGAILLIAIGLTLAAFAGMITYLCNRIRRS